MCPLLNQFALFKHINAIGIHGIRQAVRNHHNGFLLFKLLNELQNNFFAFYINVTGRFIKNIKLGIV